MLQMNPPSQASSNRGRRKNLLMLIDEKSNKAAIITINEWWLGWAGCQLMEPPSIPYTAA